MSLFDAAGLVGVLLILSAYAGAQIRRLDMSGLTSLLMNLAGACLIMVSLVKAFNLSAFLVEAAWAMVALFGLTRLILGRVGQSSQPRRGVNDPGP
jgi:hypothetical protein